MNIYFDARWTRTDRHDGVSRYGAELAHALSKKYPITLLISDKRQLHFLPEGVEYALVNKPMSLFELILPFRLNQAGANIVFSPLQVMGTWGRKYKLIITLHDLIYYRHPKPPTHISPPLRLIWWLFHKAKWPQKLLLNSADHIVTVSKTSKKQIEEAELTNKPISVVYNASSALRKNIDSVSHPIKKEIIYMGSFMPYKNVELIIKALESLPGYKLHLTSRIHPNRKKELEQLIQNKDQVKFWNGISDEDYANILSTSTALINASRDEGFGLPLIEAMEAKTPIVCTDMEIFHEVAGDSALYFNPDNPEELANNIKKLEDKEFRQQQIEKGTKQAENFSWDKSAEELIKVIQALTTQKN